MKEPFKIIYDSVLEKLVPFCRKKKHLISNVFIILGALNGNISVVCGSPLATALSTTTTTAAARESTSTIIATTPTASSLLSSVVSSTEPTSALNQNDVKVTECTATTMSEECKLGHKDEVSGKYINHFLNFSNIRIKS